MRSAMRRGASDWRSSLLGLAMMAMVALLTLHAEPAAALRLHGFDGAPPPPAVGEITHSTPLSLFNTKAVPIPTNRFWHKWVALLKSLSGERSDMLDACDGAKVACDAATTRWLAYLSGLRG